MDVLGQNIDTVTGVNAHHIGLVMVLLAWLSIIYQKMRGTKIYLPGHFFFLYGIGVLILSYSMWKKDEKITVVLFEAFIGISSILIYFL